MTVLHVDTERTWRGGEQQVMYLISGLQSRGHRCLLAAPPGAAILARVADVGAGSFELPMRGELDPAAIVGLARILRRERPEIVHMHTAHAHALGVTASRACGVGRRVVSRRVDFAIGPVSRWIKYRVGVDRYIAITRAVARVLERGGVPARRIAVVPSGIDPDRHAGGDGRIVRAALGVDAGAPLVGSIAHFAWHKGLKYLVRAWPAVRDRRPKARLVVVGSGEEESMLRAEARGAGVESSVTFPGFQSDVSHWLAAFDVYVQPSVMEGMGTSVLDALAAGKPVVATRVGGIPEIVEDGETGLLVPPSNPDALATAVLRLIDDANLAARLASSGARRVRAAFTADRMAEATLAVYREVLAEAGKSRGPGSSTRGFRG